MGIFRRAIKLMPIWWDNSKLRLESEKANLERIEKIKRVEKK